MYTICQTPEFLQGGRNTNNTQSQGWAKNITITEAQIFTTIHDSNFTNPKEKQLQPLKVLINWSLRSSFKQVLNSCLDIFWGVLDVQVTPGFWRWLQPSNQPRIHWHHGICHCCPNIHPKLVISYHPLWLYRIDLLEVCINHPQFLHAASPWRRSWRSHQIIHPRVIKP